MISQRSSRRQRIGKHAIIGKDHGTFDQVLQFADVARPDGTTLSADIVVGGMCSISRLIRRP